MSYRNGWTHIDGFSERVIDYVRLIECEDSKTVIGELARDAQEMGNDD